MPGTIISEMDCVMVPRVPRGLPPAVQGLAREILRQRPRNVYAFAARHFARLLKLRDDKEQRLSTDRVVSAEIPPRKLPDKRDGIVDSARSNNDDDDDDDDDDDEKKENDVRVAEESRNDRFRNFRRYDGSTEAKRSSTTTTWRKAATRKAAPTASKRKGETTTSSGGKSGWSVNRTVKALRQHREYRACVSAAGDIEKTYAGECCNEGSSGKRMEKVVARRRPSPPFSTKDPFVRSLSAGDVTYAKRVESRAVAQNLEKFYTVAATFRHRTNYERNERNLTRRKSADQIERTCGYFKDAIRTNQDHIADRERSRSLVRRDHRPAGRDESNAERRETARRRRVTDGGNRLNDEWKSVTDRDRREGREKSRNDDSSNSDVQRQFDESRTNDNDEPDVVGTISMVLPSVVGRPRSSGKCTGRNDVRERFEHESNEEQKQEQEQEDDAGNDNFTLPPISSDGSNRSTTRASNLIELPSLSSDVDTARHQRQRGMHRRRRSEDSTTSSTSRIRKRAQSAKASFEFANSDCDRLKATAENERNGQKDSRDNVNARDIVSPRIVYPRPCRKSSVGEGSGDPIERRVDETQIPRQPEIVRRPRSSRSSSPKFEAAEIRLRGETWKDSLSVTPDSIDLSDKASSSNERLLHGEKKNENLDEGGNETREPTCRPNELERKLIEIETMERSVENALLSSRTIADDFDDQLGDSERSIESSNRTRNFEPNSDESRSATSNENNGDDTNDHRIDEIYSKVQDETTSIRKRSNFDDSDNSKSSSFVDRDDNSDDDDADARYVGEKVERRSQPAGGVDVSCYVLTEGSPCEIPETVTTVIIPDKLVDKSGDGNVQFPIPSCFRGQTVETRERDRGEERCQDRNPFGEYIAPETGVAARCSSSVDAHFLRDVVKDAADRVPVARREDLANIKEEEENEGRPFSNILQRPSSVVECEAKLTSSGRRDDRQPSKTDRKRDTVSSRVLSNVSARPSHVAKNGNTANDRSTSDVSPSFERVEPTMNVPGLNLDSLQDVTHLASSTIGETTESENLLSNVVGSVPSDDDENISFPSSFDAFASSDNERKLNDETFESLENDRARLFGEPTVAETTETENQTYCDDSCLEFQNFDKTTERRVSSNDENDDEQGSRYVEEEEIARELIRNFIVDRTETVESNDSMTSSSSRPKPRANGLDAKSSQAEDFVVQFHPSVRRCSASKLPIDGESCRREKLDDDDDDDDDTRAERGEDERMSDEEGRRESGQPREARKNEDEMEETALSEEERKKEKVAPGCRHTGEFHDSLPLPLVETTSEDITLVCRTKPALRTTDDCQLTFPANPYPEIQRGCTRIFNVPSPPRCRSDNLSPTIVDIFENFHLLVNASSVNCDRLSSNASPCVVRVGRAADQAGSIPIYQRPTSFNSDPDHLREPLALDDAPRPIVIEEIPNTDRGVGERLTLSLPEAKANFPTEIVRLCPCSPQRRLCPSDNLRDEDEGTTSVRRTTTNQLVIDNDNLLPRVDIGSATLPPPT